MLKRLITLVALMSLSLATAAATQSSNFTVSVTLSPVCSVKTAATNINFGTYTPFTNAAINNTSSAVTFQCSQGISPSSVGFTKVTGTFTDMSNSVASTGAATAEGVLSGLRYTLAIPSVAAALAAGQAGATATAGAGGTGGVNSTGKEFVFGITANMAGGQAGGVGGDTSQTWQVVLSY
jgi:hypothetical protein